MGCPTAAAVSPELVAGVASLEVAATLIWVAVTFGTFGVKNRPSDRPVKPPQRLPQDRFKGRHRRDEGGRR